MVLADGHRSLRDDFEVSSPELDAAVASCQAAPGCHGARLTGGGFAGCVVALVDTAYTDLFAEAVLGDYRARTGLQGALHLCVPVDGSSLVPVIAGSNMAWAR
ncbi:hypothetical protein I6A84_20185 [Frankia sp. CNm7]|uniref:GHMP kinase C-terminal domain-containing protein n=1 Tax=Frankia nepalensis TaxID=1836974 RepID=A0A937RH26_9ACTN|nr:hypothetical protein [Frankia nepalensis]MBL7512006.1 hypothetical protein [Frankia nepalensis]MBL7520344.1 hypothetical protein [Frankia nepalensis]MBL7632058.1 hypothetical protein [Frankia nepalensis]